MLNEQDQEESLLTEYDRKWLAALSESHRSWAPLILAEIRGAEPQQICKLAGDILVYHNRMFVTARQLVEATINDIRYSQVFEAYDYQCACAVFHMSSKLSESDSRALLLASSYYGADLVDMATNSNQALTDAHAALYSE